MKINIIFAIISVSIMGSNLVYASCFQDEQNILSQLHQYHSVIGGQGQRFLYFDFPATEKDNTCFAKGYMDINPSQHTCTVKWEKENWANTLACSS